MRINFSRMNWESEAMWDMIHGHGFLITEQPFSDIDKTIRCEFGPRSPLYGDDWNSASTFQERYTCKCGQLVGSAFEGEICPECGTKVEYHEVDIEMTGWLSVFPYHILNPSERIA